jgi:transcriptional regulator with XRE-family HTH domain
MLRTMASQQAPVSFNQRVGRNIQRFRKAANLSQDQLGEELGRHGFPMKQQTILTIEGGKRPLKAEELYVIAEVLQVDPGSLTAQSDKRAAALERFRTAETAIARCDRERRGYQQEVDRLTREIERLDHERHKAAEELVALFTAEGRAADLAKPYIDLPPAEEMITTWEQARRG